MIFEWSSVQQIRTVIDRIAGTELEWPPENDGVYIVTFNHWENQPTSKAKQSKAKQSHYILVVQQGMEIDFVHGLEI
ncbi:putative uncharacterized protein [Moritella viscosa]|nr:hypothetical protein [Moritella viscosa]CED60241.1 putative uncharacterized protein [Moritella viscosa]SHO14229.1 Putative uncharacterized protein [Moritella viscosa]